MVCAESAVLKVLPVLAPPLVVTTIPALKNDPHAGFQARTMTSIMIFITLASLAVYWAWKFLIRLLRFLFFNRESGADEVAFFSELRAALQKACLFFALIMCGTNAFCACDCTHLLF